MLRKKVLFTILSDLLSTAELAAGVPEYHQGRSLSYADFKHTILPGPSAELFIQVGQILLEMFPLSPN